MKFPILIACLLIPSLGTGNEAPKSKRLRCGSRAMELPPQDQPRFPRPHSFQEDQPFVPYKILYLIDNTIDQSEIVKLEKATEYVNVKLSKAIKARKLADVRFRNLHPTTCNDLCAHIPFPDELLIPCRSTIVAEPSDEIKKLNEATYTLVVRVLVRNEGVVANKQIEIIGAHCIGRTIAFARSCELTSRAEYDQGPHHGFVILCAKPSSVSDEDLRSVILHETLHILMPFSLSGLGGNTHNCGLCKDKIWKDAKRQAKNEHGQPIEITTEIAISPFSQNAARDHFGCESAEGLELNFYVQDRSSMEIKTDRLHWSEHLFPDEILAPVKSTAARFSNLTLSALASHDKWYRVDLSQAEPLAYSMPSKEFACDVARKSCFEILNEQTGRAVQAIRPFCDAREGTNRVITSHCSPDHQSQLSCEDKVSSSQCAFLMGTDDHIYNTDVCANATTMEEGTLASHVGAYFGPGTICVTTTNFPPWESHKTNALCLRHECQADTLILKFNPNNNDDPNCYITCAKGLSNQLLTKNWCNKAEHEVTIICPDYEQVCKKETTTPTTTSTVPKTTSTVPATTTSTVPFTTSSIPTSTSTPTTMSTESTTTSTVPWIKSTSTSTGSAPASLDPGDSATISTEDKPPIQVTSSPLSSSSSTGVQASNSQESVSRRSLKTMAVAFICIQVLNPS